MIESTVLSAMAGKSTITSLITVYENRPAIFNKQAPERATLPYIVFRVNKSAGDSIAVDIFSVNIDFHDHGTSDKNAVTAAFEIDNLFDQKIFSHPRFAHIRFFRFAAGPIPTVDPRDIHYNVQLTARAGRSGWMSTL